MEWYNYVSGFWAGMFLANAIPHFVKGASGDKFPTPFANPPGQGLSSSTTNVYWALLNMLIGFVLFIAAGIPNNGYWGWFVFFAGIATISLYLSKRFTTKHKE